MSRWLLSSELSPGNPPLPTRRVGLEVFRGLPIYPRTSTSNPNPSHQSTNVASLEIGAVGENT